LKNLIPDLNLCENINLNSKITREKFSALINNHDIGMVPYLQTDYMNLALSTKAFEYITTGLPMIAAKLKNLYETFDDQCITYVEDYKPEGIAIAVKYLCLNPQTRKEQMVNAKQNLSELSGSVMKQRLVVLYDV